MGVRWRVFFLKFPQGMFRAGLYVPCSVWEGGLDGEIMPMY